MPVRVADHGHGILRSRNNEPSPLTSKQNGSVVQTVLNRGSTLYASVSEPDAPV